MLKLKVTKFQLSAPNDFWAVLKNSGEGVARIPSVQNGVKTSLYNDAEDKLKCVLLNYIQAGVFCYHMGCPSVSPSFVVKLPPNLAWPFSETKSLKEWGHYDVYDVIFALLSIEYCWLLLPEKLNFN